MCALATPFTANGALDLDAFSRLIDYQLDAGTQALVVAGSTGEAHMLEGSEFVDLLRFAVRHVAGRAPVIAGTGAAATRETVLHSQRARDAGADAVLVVAPYYVRPDQAGMMRHFTRVADQAGVPVILYNVPARTACDLLPATVQALREHPAIVGIKEAVADPARISALAALARTDFAYLSGDDGSAAQAMLAGAAGCVSVVANVAPVFFRQLCDAARAGDADTASRLAADLQPLLDALNAGPNPVPVKAGLAALGLGHNSVREPLLALTDGQAVSRITAALAALNDQTRKQTR